MYNESWAIEAIAPNGAIFYVKDPMAGTFSLDVAGATCYNNETRAVDLIVNSPLRRKFPKYTFRTVNATLSSLRPNDEFLNRFNALFGLSPMSSPYARYNLLHK